MEVLTSHWLIFLCAARARSRYALAVIHSLRLVKLEECENMTFPGTDSYFLVNPRSYYARVCLYSLDIFNIYCLRFALITLILHRRAV